MQGMKLWLQTSSTLMCNGLAQLQLGQELHLPTESLNNSPGHHRHSQQAALEQPPPEWTPLTKTTPCPAPPQATSEAKQDVSWGTTEWGVPMEICHLMWVSCLLPRGKSSQSHCIHWHDCAPSSPADAPQGVQAVEVATSIHKSRTLLEGRGAKASWPRWFLTLRLTPAILRSRTTKQTVCFNRLGLDQTIQCYKAAWEHSPLPRDRGELRNIRYKTFKGYLIYSHFALRELEASQTSCSHQGSASTALLSKLWASGCQVLTSIVVREASVVTDSTKIFHFLYVIILKAILVSP